MTGTLDANGNRTTTVYDALNRKQVEVDALGYRRLPAMLPRYARECSRYYGLPLITMKQRAIHNKAALTALALTALVGVVSAFGFQVPPRYLNGAKAITSMAVSTDGSRILTGTGDGVGRFWDTSTGVMTCSLIRANNKFGSESSCVALSADGSFAFVGFRDGVADFWDLKRHELLKEVKGGDDALTEAAFSRDCRYAVAASQYGEVKVWTVPECRPVKALGVRLDPEHEYTGAAFSPDSKELLTKGWHDVKVWNCTDWRLIKTLRPSGPDGLVVAAWSPDGSGIAAAGSTGIFVWDYPGGEERCSAVQPNGETLQLAFSPDGTQLLTMGAHGTSIDTILWDAYTGRLLKVLPIQAGQLITVNFLPDGRTIVTGGADSYLRFWDVATGALLRKIDVGAAIFGPKTIGGRR